MPMPSIGDSIARPEKKRNASNMFVRLFSARSFLQESQAQTRTYPQKQDYQFSDLSNLDLIELCGCP